MGYLFFILYPVFKEKLFRFFPGSPSRFGKNRNRRNSLGNPVKAIAGQYLPLLDEELAVKYLKIVSIR